jgi:hypothetical protein
VSEVDVIVADLASAEAEAREAAELVAALESAALAGSDNVSPAQIAAQESLSRFARVRAETTRRQAALSRSASRCSDVTGQLLTN